MQTSGSEDLTPVAVLLLRARSATDAYAAVAWTDEPYLLRFDGREWTTLDSPVDGPITSLAVTADGSLWLTAGVKVWSKSVRGHWDALELPPVPSGDQVFPRQVSVAGEDEVWVAGAYSAGPAAKAAALFTTAELR